MCDSTPQVATVAIMLARLYQPRKNQGTLVHTQQACAEIRPRVTNLVLSEDVSPVCAKTRTSISVSKRVILEYCLVTLLVSKIVSRQPSPLAVLSAPRSH